MNSIKPTGAMPLLKGDERIACKNLAVSQELHGKRARTLLLLDDGRTQTQTAAESGLSLGQVRYVLTQFRKKRMEIFPESTLSEHSETTTSLYKKRATTSDSKVDKAQKKESKEKKKKKPDNKSKKAKKDSKGKTKKKPSKGKKKGNKRKDEKKSKKGKSKKQGNKKK